MPVYHKHIDIVTPPYLKPKRSHLTAVSVEANFRPPSSTFSILPTELQIEIFVHFLPTYPRVGTAEGPVLLSRVCKSWRQLVYFTPRLWSSFEVDVTAASVDTPSTYAKSNDMMTRWLQLSKNYPLSVRIVHNPLGRVPDQRSARLVAALIPHTHRWRNIQLIIPASDVVTLQQPLPLNLPQLQTLTLHLNGNWSSRSSLDITTLNISWHQLAILDLQLEHNNLLSFDKCLEILSQTERLERFSVNAECVLTCPGDFTEPILLPKLETLDLVLHGGASGIAESHMTHFLARLSLPRLCDLRLAWLVRQAAAWAPNQFNFVTFLRSVAQTTCSLSIRYLPLSADQLVECLSALPNVCHLDLRFSLGDCENDPITDQFFTKCTVHASADRMKRRTPNPHILPNLHYLNLHCYGKRYTSPVFVAFLESRMKVPQSEPGPLPTSTLTSFHLLSMLPPLPSMEKRLGRYRLQGLDVSVETLLVR
ncbi:hypothetical protein HYPSUDRAFT_71629 [Hypholoma sublateritium FD-334 SS-4]|uniref:F-box domain-containing protein n=1 Tax=Hypholoma sublateritium (strain FD-334 SS-4) TaxID=945553 RepID=A0A0D2NAF5_HYPSF|nr:hypothetical protein HYPSUDRAFT_71629 [Hypholoma sublateritium FD-334 SS-4]